MKHPGTQRPNDVNQKIANPMRPQLPSDGTAGMQRWEPGQLPKGGYRSIIDFSEGSYNTKQSPTCGGGSKVY